MTSIDKAAIGFTIVITLIGVAIALAGLSSADERPTNTVPDKMMDDTMMDDKMMKDMMDDDKMMKDMMDDTMMDDKMMKDMMDDDKMMDDTNMDATEPKTVRIDIPTGTAIPGCEVDNECYLPADISINAGDTVEWDNVDNAAHTVTGGNPEDGPSDVFDSGLVFVDAQYSFTFEEAGDYDYFCRVHPWMVGSVSVN